LVGKVADLRTPFLETKTSQDLPAFLIDAIL